MIPIEWKKYKIEINDIKWIKDILCIKLKISEDKILLKSDSPAQR